MNNESNVTILTNEIDIKTSYDFLFKVSFIGDSGTGKTSLLLRLSENIFKENTSSTIGVDFKILSVKYKNKLAKVQIWDTCGSERFKSLTTSFIKACTVFVIIFDLNNIKSFENLNYWLKLVLENTSPKLLCLVGNKFDLIKEDNHVIDKTKILEFASKNNLFYIETSAKENMNLERMFKYISEGLFIEAIKQTENRNYESEFSVGYKTILSSSKEGNISSEKNNKISIKHIKTKKKICCSK